MQKNLICITTKKFWQTHQKLTILDRFQKKMTQFSVFQTKLLSLKLNQKTLVFKVNIMQFKIMILEWVLKHFKIEVVGQVGQRCRYWPCEN